MSDRIDRPTGGGSSTATSTPSQTTAKRPAKGTDYASQRAEQAAESVKDTAAQATEDAKQQAKELSEQAKRKAQEAAQRAKESGRQYAAEKQARVADEIGTFSSAIRKASQKLHEEEHDSIANYVDATAEKLDEIRDSLSSKNVADLIDDVQQFTRRRPEIVYGGLFVAGLAAMRFLKASKPTPTRSEGAGGPQDSSHRTAAAGGRRVSTSEVPIGYRGDGSLNPIGQRSQSNPNGLGGGNQS